MSDNGRKAVEAIIPWTCDAIQATGEVLKVRQGDTIRHPPDGRGSLRVLVVDDDRDTADSMSRLVKLWGYDVRVAYAGAAALDMARTYQPNVLLLDVAMPRMDGCRLAEHLRQQVLCRPALLIAITGYADEGHRQLCAKAGFDQLLIKPVTPAAVKTLLRLERDRLAGSGDRPGRVHAVPLAALGGHSEQAMSG